MISCCEFGLNIYLSASKGLESHFFQFSVYPRGWKAIFFNFLFIQGVGKPLFSVFCSSEGSESHFFQFSVHPRGRKAIFFCFLLIRGLGKPLFSIFCSSEGSESHFFQFSAHPRPRKAVFLFFPLETQTDSQTEFTYIMLWQSIQYSKVPNSE